MLMYTMIYADHAGRFYENPGFSALGRTGNMFVEPDREEMVELPGGASLVLISGGHPAGIDQRGKFILMEKCPGNGGAAWAVGALLPQGYTRTLLPAYRRKEGDRPLPLYGYAAVAWREGKVYVAARRTDDPHRWDPVNYDTPDLPELVKKRLEEQRGNRILRQLARCSLDYHCFTAQNIFYRRWEGGLPVSPSCNARCLGCISEQPAECCPSPQTRIDFNPSVEEVADIAVRHLSAAPGAIISFGQGCEGEPSLAWETIVGAIRRVRSETASGTINMNSNAGYTAGVEKICEAGLNSMRVSTISARELIYNAYYRPRGYGFRDVCASMKAAGSRGVYVSLNLLLFPGLTDREEEVEALVELIKGQGVNMVQLRNLNIDPDLLMQKIPPAAGEIIGVPELIKTFKNIPGLKVGNFSHPVK